MHVYRVRALGFDPWRITAVEVARLPELWAERVAAHETERERLAAEAWPLARRRKQRTATFSATMAARLEAIGYVHGDTNPIAWLFDRLQEAGADAAAERADAVAFIQGVPKNIHGIVLGHDALAAAIALGDHRRKP